MKKEVFDDDRIRLIIKGMSPEAILTYLLELTNAVQDGNLSGAEALITETFRIRTELELFLATPLKNFVGDNKICRLNSFASYVANHLRIGTEATVADLLRIGTTVEELLEADINNVGEDTARRIIEWLHRQPLLQDYLEKLAVAKKSRRLLDTTIVELKICDRYETLARNVYNTVSTERCKELGRSKNATIRDLLSVWDRLDYFTNLGGHSREQTRLWIESHREELGINFDNL